MDDYILEMQQITKEFPGVKALNNVNFKVKRGEIHCLVGENGAGKSTLMKVLSGVYPHGTYEGNIIFNGEIQNFRHISDSEKVGIGIIYQELALIPELSIYENVYFGHERKHSGFINWNETIIEAEKVLKKVRLKIPLSTKVKELGVGNQQLVEIAKALSKNVSLLILDEPTAALNEDDSQNLLMLLTELKKTGVTCIMISHKLKEIIAIADTITVLRDGGTICSIDANAQVVSEKEIIRNMVGREIDNIFPRREKIDIGDVCFQIENWTVDDPTKGRTILENICMNVREGEIVGLQGLMGAGRTELALSIFGNVPRYKIRSGQLRLSGKPISLRNPSNAIRNGIGYVTEDRKGNGLVLIQDIKYNISIANLKNLTRRGMINDNEEVVVAMEYKDNINIKAPSVEQLVGNLSGGNQQKVQLAKWMYVGPKVLILDEPTRGIDVGAKFEIYTLMNKLVESGMSIIMISSELPEILGMSDRLYVMSEGRIAGELSGKDATEEAVMALAIQSKGDVL